MRCGLLNGIAYGDAFAGVLSATQAVRRRRHQPIGQDREGPPAGTAYSTSHPDRFVLIVVALAESPSVTDDCVLPADGTPSRQKGQGDHPGSVLSFDSGSAIKRITASVKAAADRRCQVSIWGLAFTLPVKTVSNEKRILPFGSSRRPSAYGPSSSDRGEVQCLSNKLT